MAGVVAYDAFDPCREPDWRFQRVLSIVNRPGEDKRPGRCSKYDDEWVRGLRGLYVLHENAKERNDERVLFQLKTKNPGLYHALRIHQRSFDSPIETFQLRSRILSGMSDEKIAAAQSTQPSTIHWYEKLFFNVRDRLTSQDWIVRKVLYPAIVEAETYNADAGNDDGAYVPKRANLVDPLWDPRVLWFAYFWKEVAVDFLLTGFYKDAGPRSQEDMDAAMNNHLVANLARLSNMGLHALPMNKYNAAEIMSVYGQFLSIAKQNAEEEEKQSLIEKSVNAMLGDMPWAVGAHTKLVGNSAAIEQYDQSPVELRTDQMLQLGSGGELPQDEIEEIQRRMQGMPEAPERKDLDQGQQEIVNANT